MGVATRRIAGRPPRTVVVGGGFAGLAAATALADLGHEVHLVERRPFVGGKAFSFDDPVAGHAVDNGQHAFLSAYRNTLTLLERWGAGGLVAFGPRLEMFFMAAPGRAQRFAATGLPAPAHLMGALLRFEALSLQERVAMVRPALALLSLDAAGRRELDRTSFAVWLSRHGQSRQAVRAFWEPLALAAVNGPPQEVSAYMALQVLALGFLGSERTSRLGFATQGLSTLVEPFAPYFTARGGTLVTGREVRAVREAGDPSSALRWEVAFRDGAILAADAVVLAVPTWRLARLLDAQLRQRAGLAAIEGLASSPIVSIQMVLDRSVVEHEAVALLDSPIHWVFAAGRLRSDAPPGALALTVSAGRELASSPQAEVAAIARRELERFFPAARQAQVLACRVIKEMDATVSCAPGSEALRPPQETALAGLAVAGAWTRTGLPGTIEGAVMSGLLAVEAIERERGQARKLVQALPEPGGVARIARWLGHTPARREGGPAGVAGG